MISLYPEEKGEGPLRKDWMTRSKAYDFSQGRIIPIYFVEAGIDPGIKNRIQD